MIVPLDFLLPSLGLWRCWLLAVGVDGSVMEEVDDEADDDAVEVSVSTFGTAAGEEMEEGGSE